MGNGRVIRAGELQYMAAGTGVMHSEFNPSPKDPVHLLQVWILPDRRGVKPGYADRSFASAPTGSLTLLASKDGRDNSIRINQDADVFVARFAGGDAAKHQLKPGRHAWVQVAEGEVKLNRQQLGPGDGAALSEESALEFAAQKPAQALV